jgi:hypothetical protein
MKRSSTANPGAAHHHNHPDAPRNDAVRPPSPIGSASHLVRLINITSSSGARELLVSLDIDQRCVGQPLAQAILGRSRFATAALAPASMASAALRNAVLLRPLWQWGYFDGQEFFRIPHTD